MTVTIDQAAAVLNMDLDDLTVGDAVELQLYVDAANEWVAAKIVDTTPAPVKLGTLELLRHLWESQRGPQSNPLTGDDIVPVSGVGYAIPNRVLELLAPYLPKQRPTGSFPPAACWPDPQIPLRGSGLIEYP